MELSKIKYGDEVKADGYGDEVFIVCYVAQRIGTDDFEYIIQREKNGDWVQAVFDKSELTKVYREWHRWRGEEGEKYYHATLGGEIRKACDLYTGVDKYFWSIGNYFKTKEEAELYKEKLIAYQTVKDDAKGFEPDWGDFCEEKWHVKGDYNSDKDDETPFLSTDNSFGLPYGVGGVYFSTEGEAKESITKHEAEWLFLFDKIGLDEYSDCVKERSKNEE